MYAETQFLQVQSMQRYQMAWTQKLLLTDKDQFVEVVSEEAGREIGERAVALGVILVKTGKSSTVTVSDVHSWACPHSRPTIYLRGLIYQVTTLTIEIPPA